MQKLVYALCILVTVPFMLFSIPFTGEFPLVMVLFISFLVILLLNWFINIRKPVPEILRLTFRSFLVTIGANFLLALVLLSFYILTIMAGWWNR